MTGKYLRFGCEKCERLCMIVYRVFEDEKPKCPFGLDADFDKISEITIP